MKKWIRWQGLAAFVVVAGVLIALWLLFVDGIVKSVIEKTGMAIVGAEVDVKADVNLFPLGITLRELQVTNPQAPATNSLECARIAFSLDSLNLLRRKVIITEMAVEGMQFDTPRKRPGKVIKPTEKKRTEEKKASFFSLPVEIPDGKKILQSENLESLKLIEAARADLQKKRADWQQRLEEMPNRATLDAYRAKVEKIRQAPKDDVFDMAGQLGEVRALRRDLEQDIERVRKTRAAF